MATARVIPKSCRSVGSGHGRSRARGALRIGFTLVELLVVVTIIALLIAILLPSLKKARYQAKNVLCMSNLHAIGVASGTYASEDRRNVYPDGETLGWSSFRVMAKRIFAFGTEETYSLPAVYDRNGAIPRDAKVWICPLNMTELNYAETVMGQDKYRMERDYGVTYRVSTQNTYTQNPSFYKPGGISDKERDPNDPNATNRRRHVYWVTDNWNLRPFKSGEKNGSVLNPSDPMRASGNNTNQFRDEYYWHRGTTKRFTVEDENGDGGVPSHGWGINALLLDLSAGFQAQSATQRGRN